jgi:hypothetical protein
MNFEILLVEVGCSFALEKENFDSVTFGISLIFLQFMTGKNIDEKECFGKKSMKIFDLEKRFCNL